MIVSFIHKGLEKFYLNGSTAGLQVKHTKKVKRVLHGLDKAEKPEDMDFPGFKLHPLRGNRKGIWAVSVSGNWRITFSFNGRNAQNVNYEDYH